MGTVNILNASSIDSALAQAASDANQPVRGTAVPADSPAGEPTPSVIFRKLEEAV
jgi:hypothetical protein